MASSLLARLRAHFTSPLGLFFLLGSYVALVEMRPGRLLYILTFLLFRDSLVHFLLYGLGLGFSFMGVLVLLLNRNKALYWAALAFWFPCLLISLVYRFITGYNFMYTDAVLAWNNKTLAGTALQNYVMQIGAAFLACLFLLAGMHEARRKSSWRMHPVAGLLFPIAAAAVYAQIKWTTGVVDDFPALYRVPLNLLTAFTDQLPQPVRQPVSVFPVTPGVPHLFLVVDESVTATELSLQNPALRTTPFLYSVRKQLYDFGIASAIINESAGANIALMSGTRPAEIPDTAFRTFSRTNIFQFAKKAGYVTYYIDAQLGGGVLQNFMSPEDLKYIDHVERPATQRPTLAYYERDMLVAKRLTQLAKHPQKVFAYVVKAGAHWPYARTYPPDSTFFKPVLSPRSLSKDQTRTLNTYHNSIRWTVDEFWRKLMTNISPEDSTMIVYTSDHGQNLIEAGISMAHASVHDTSPQEVAVPLWLWDPAHLAFKATAAQSNPSSSHFHIFPTLLRLQGYSPLWVQQHYGPSLLGPATGAPRFFLTGDLFGRGSYALRPFQWPIAKN